MRSVMLTLLLAGCGGPRWTEAFDTTGMGALSGVWGSGPSDVWVVGGSPGVAEVMHHDGEAWSPVEVPAGDLLVWVYGFGPDDIWAVGQSGSVVHRTADGWSTVPIDTTEDLWGVWGAAPDDLWVVGGAIDVGDPLIFHWDGSGFTQHALAAEENDRGARSLFKVYGQDGRVFAVGQAGLIIEWDGSAWRQMSTGAAADEDFVSLWGDANGITAVGGRAAAQVATLDGDAWTTTTPVGMPGLSAISIDSGGTVLVGGTAGFVGHLEAGEIVREEPPVGTSHDIHAMWSDGEGTTFGVGGRFYEPYEGTAWTREEG